MADDKSGKTVEERLLDTLVANSEALTHLNASVANHTREYAEGRVAAREHANGLNAKVENMDRSIGEIRLAATNAEASRQNELKRIYDLLTEERNDRRTAVVEGREGERAAQKSEKDLLREMIQEELGERRAVRTDNRAMMKTVGKEIWKAGGKYIIAGIVILILAAVMKLTGTNLADLIGLARK